MQHPRLLLLGTGGTIAGTAPESTQLNRNAMGMIGAEGLLDLLPELASLAEIQLEQIANVDSADLSFNHWRSLADDPGLEGVVITHGINTLEETAWLMLQANCCGSGAVYRCEDHAKLGLRPNRLCSYLFELSQVFNRFDDQVPVLKADLLKCVLGLLGIATLERM